MSYEIEDIPAHLKMNELGCTLIARNILFLKIFHLPRSQWNALKDRVINVPVEQSDVHDTVQILANIVRDRVVNVPLDNQLVEVSIMNSLPRDMEEAEKCLTNQAFCLLMSILK